MDEIQKVLVKEGRKDLAQKYYEKVAAGKDFTVAQLNSAIKKLINMSERDMTEAMGKGEGLTKEAMKNLVYVESPKFKNTLRFTKSRRNEALQAIYQIKAYDKSVESESDALRVNIYVSWDGTDFEAAY